MRIHNNTQFSDEFRMKLSHMIEPNRDKAEKIAEEKGIQFLKGCRFYDTERVCYMACGMLVDRHEGKAAEAAASLGDDEMTRLVVDALVESGSADHWYTYEKEW